LIGKGGGIRMALMITLDDAMEVLIRGGYLGESWTDDDSYDYVRSELEQKCYSMRKRDTDSWFEIVRKDIETITSLEEIGKHIAESDLRKWLEMYRDNIIAGLTLAVRQEGR
jgi:hypothetical protein